MQNAGITITGCTKQIDAVQLLRRAEDRQFEDQARVASRLTKYRVVPCHAMSCHVMSYHGTLEQACVIRRTLERESTGRRQAGGALYAGLGTPKAAGRSKTRRKCHRNADQSRKAEVGFEPTTNGFAIRPLRPLGYSAKLCDTA